MRLSIPILLTLLVAGCPSQPEALDEGRSEPGCGITIDNEQFLMILPCGFEETSEFTRNPNASYEGAFVNDNIGFTMAFVQVIPGSVVPGEPTGPSLEEMFPDAETEEHSSFTTLSGGTVEWMTMYVEGAQMNIALAELSNGDILYVNVVNERGGSHLPAGGVISSIDIRR